MQASTAEVHASPARSGLAPEWGSEHGSCDGACQRWVSACVLARVDAAGVKRDDLASAATTAPCAPTATSCASTPSARRRTSATCSSRASRASSACRPGKTSDERVCGDSLDDCPMTVVGSCDDACATTGPYGSFGDCSDNGRPAAAPSTTKASRSFCRSSRCDRQGRSWAGFSSLAEAGSGGMGTVYRARDLTDGATVAVKILTGREVREAARFEQEARDPVGADAPGDRAVPGHGVAESGERFIAMEWLDGEDLGDAAGAQAGHGRRGGGAWRADRPRRWRTRTSAASSTATSSPRTCSCPALAIERLKVLDFGIARLTRGARKLTRDRVGDRNARVHGARAGAGRARRHARAPTCSRSAACCSSA